MSICPYTTSWSLIETVEWIKVVFFWTYPILCFKVIQVYPEMVLFSGTLSLTVDLVF